MRIMRKRIIAVLCICMCVLGLAACGTDPKSVDYNGKTYAELEEYAKTTWEGIKSMDLSQMEPIVAEIDAMSEAERIALMKANEGLEENYLLIKSWIAVSKEAGTYVDIDSFSVTKTGKTTTTELLVKFDKRSVMLSIVYKNRDMSVETTTVELVYTTGEKMQKAALNTVMGMGTVFVMLIIICLIISLFRFIPVLEDKLKNRKADGQEKATVGTQPTAAAIPEAAISEAETDNLELVAVIAAAIAASTGQSTDDFVVRSIKRR